jgi:hypothetical protein
VTYIYLCRPMTPTGPAQADGVCSETTTKRRSDATKGEEMCWRAKMPNRAHSMHLPTNLANRQKEKRGALRPRLGRP